MDFGEVGLNKTLQICNSNDIDIVGAEGRKFRGQHQKYFIRILEEKP